MCQVMSKSVAKLDSPFLPTIPLWRAQGTNFTHWLLLKQKAVALYSSNNNSFSEGTLGQAELL